ncbi:uncharacterized protein LOC119444501 isoform X2 [Dermacentor silvarum]|uniref:uncharacterized protein LOC119444501 isoform X2 n=1 Tax=Dermacentor silvarum TaxID=543639 RepID=UPI0021011BD9|nr:uncharacterized protein LOC119444501 isoform X2 [Dermacentor silvarum]
MFALVRFIDDDMDKRQYVIPVHDIEEFDPVDENDFSNKTAYRAKWHDPDNDINDGTYTIQILRLAETKEDMQRKMLLKRPIIPPISLSDIENGTDDDEMTQKRKVLRQESKKKRLNRAASKKQQFEDVLSKYTAHALQINDAVRNKSSIVKAHVSAGEGSREPQRRQVSSPVASQLAKKRKRSDTPCTSESDDGLVPENKVRAARKEARFWKAQYRLQCEHNTSLKNQLSFLQETVKAQLG